MTDITHFAESATPSWTVPQALFRMEKHPFEPHKGFSHDLYVTTHGEKKKLILDEHHGVVLTEMSDSDYLSFVALPKELLACSSKQANLHSTMKRQFGCLSFIPENEMVNDSRIYRKSYVACATEASYTEDDKIYTIKDAGGKIMFSGFSKTDGIFHHEVGRGDFNDTATMSAVKEGGQVISFIPTGSSLGYITSQGVKEWMESPVHSGSHLLTGTTRGKTSFLIVDSLPKPYEAAFAGHSVKYTLIQSPVDEEEHWTYLQGKGKMSKSPSPYMYTLTDNTMEVTSLSLTSGSFLYASAACTPGSIPHRLLLNHQGDITYLEQS